MKPEPRFFLLLVAKLVGLDRLRPFADLRPQHVHRVFQSDMRADFLCTAPQGKSSSQRFVALVMFWHSAAIRGIAGKGDSCAWWMEDDQIPEPIR